VPKPRSCLTDLRCCLSPGLFRALGDPTRLALLLDLAARTGERSVSELGGCCPVDLSVVSRHLRMLREAGVVEARRDGKEVRYRVRYDALVAELRALADALEACCGPQRPRESRGRPGAGRARRAARGGAARGDAVSGRAP
jgi:DNA-binding transcriptional ArsR family regulator